MLNHNLGSFSSPASLGHPGLRLLQTVFGDVPHFGVFCTKFIAKGVRFGPFRGKVVNASEVKTHKDNSLMWEVSVSPGAAGGGGRPQAGGGGTLGRPLGRKTLAGAHSSRTSLCTKSAL